MKQKKRILIILFCVILSVNVFPVFAEEYSGDNIIEEEANPVAGVESGTLDEKGASEAEVQSDCVNEEEFEKEEEEAIVAYAVETEKEDGRYVVDGCKIIVSKSGPHKGDVSISNEDGSGTLQREPVYLHVIK